MPYDIVERLQEINDGITLSQLSNAVKPSDKKRGKLHEVLKDSFDNKEYFTEKFIEQESDYIHWNPCSEKWNLAACPEDYLYSSARFYRNGVRGFELWIRFILY